MSFRSLIAAMYIFSLLLAVPMAEAACSVFVIEAEARASQQGFPIMQRSNASQHQTALLHCGDSFRQPFQVCSRGSYVIGLRYSNDNNDFDPTETITIRVDGIVICRFNSIDTNNWNTFTTKSCRTQQLASGSHLLKITVSGGDGYGIEFDKFMFKLL